MGSLELVLSLYCGGLRERGADFHDVMSYEDADAEGGIVLDGNVRLPIPLNYVSYTFTLEGGHP